MELQDLQYKKENHIATITFDNPEKLNAMTGQMCRSFSDIIEHVRHDDDVRVVVFTGEGKGFNSGADTEMLIALAEGKPVPGGFDEDEGRRHRLEPIGWFGAEVALIEKPTIAAIKEQALIL